MDLRLIPGGHHRKGGIAKDLLLVNCAEPVKDFDAEPFFVVLKGRSKIEED